MIVYKLFSCVSIESNNQAIAAVALLKSEGFDVESKIEPRTTMTLAKGKINPKSGWVVQTVDGTVLTTVYEVVDYLREKGLVRLA